MTKATLAILLAISLVGCSTKWITVAQADLPILVNIATAISGLADPNQQAEIKEYANEVATDLALVKQLVDEYNSASSAGKLTAQQKITQTLTEVSSHLQSILAATHVKSDTKSQHITQAVNVAILTVNAIVALIGNSKVAVSLPGPEQLQASLDGLTSGGIAKTQSLLATDLE